MAKKSVTQQRLEAFEKTSFEQAGIATVPPLELDIIEEGEHVQIPEHYQVYAEPVRGTDNKMVYVLTTDDRRFFLSWIIRGAKSLTTNKYVRPEGSVSKASQNYAKMDDFFKQELAGKWVKVSRKEEVTARGYNGEESRIAKVYTIDFCDADGNLIGQDAADNEE